MSANVRTIPGSIAQIIGAILLSQFLFSVYRKAIINANSWSWWEFTVRSIVTILAVPALYLAYFIFNAFSSAAQNTYFNARDEANKHTLSFISFRLQKIRDFKSPSYKIENVNNRGNFLDEPKARILSMNLNNQEIV
jgi:hypothetical protein